MKKSTAHLLTFFIPGKKYRLAARHYLREYSREGGELYKEFKRAEVLPNSVLVCEPNNGHSEVVIGYVKYLLDMGYHVDVLLTVKNLHENAFCRFSHPRLRIFGYGQHLLAKVLKLKKIAGYEFVMITSTWCFWTNLLSLPQTIGYMPQGRRKTIFVEHEQHDLDAFKMQDMVENRQIITLGKFPRGIMVNPHFFGDVQITPRHEHETHFIVVGTISKECRDHTLLFDAARRLLAAGAKFKISVVGNGSADDIPEDIRAVIDLKGRLSFADMYREMEDADFFLPLLDIDNPSHRRYITTGVTGSTQLIYGFAKPCLIQKDFADFYRLTPQNSFIYEHDMGEAMLQAASADSRKYEEMQKNLQQTASDIYQESLHNFREMLKN